MPATPCRHDQIINPKTNRCVLRSGKIGRQVVANMGKTATIKMKNTSTGDDVKVRVGEVYTGRFRKSFVELHLSQAFFKTLRKRPKVLRNKEGNAYVFGKLFKGKEYNFSGHHFNEGAQTGIVKMDKNLNLRKIMHEPTWYRVMDIISDACPARWEDPRALRIVQKELSSNIVFLGDTDGDKIKISRGIGGGADVYIHRNGSTGKIDSIIIDNNYLDPNDMALT
jgi:hypothetical protein